MGKQTIPALVEGGNATAGPPLGPALGAAKVNIGQVIAAINEKTAAFKGISVPIKVIIDTGTKQFEVEVGTPPVSALIKKELGITENVKEESGVKGKKIIGNLSIDQVVRVAKSKQSASLATTLKNGVKEVMGTCKSMGVTVENKDPKETIQETDSGAFDEKIK
ncbi:50S ribosomal protein L11 [Candidatus Micrarchaeota archaeon]|nr:50S ribosomal protein L11 [Candidatus Micrarchaeota archaeon]